jgi:hypothetical protein
MGVRMKWASLTCRMRLKGGVVRFQ